MLPEPRSIIKRPRPEITLPMPERIERFSRTNRQLSIVDIWQVLVRRKVAILTVAAIIFCLAAAYAFLKTPVYEGVARVQIDPSRSGNMGLADDSEKPPSSDTD